MRVCERERRERAVHDAALLAADHDAGALEDAEMLHETGEGHAEGLGELSGSGGIRRQPLDHGAARRIGERGENGAQALF